MTSSEHTQAAGGPGADTTDPVEKVVVIGTGFIGLPLGLLLAKHGKQVVGVDIDENLVKAINDQSLRFDETELQRIIESEDVQANLTGKTEPTSGDAFVVSVPTPLEEPKKSPDLTHIEAAIDSIIPHLETGDLINVESTIPPLTCENFIAPRLEEAGYSPGNDVQLAHSPERILPGNVFEEIVSNDRIIGGFDDKSRRRAAKIYEPFLEGDIFFTDLVSAELCKLMENTFRDVNVALANEFGLIADDLGVDPHELLGLANNHPRVDIMTPGIGVGGHCLPVDPWFLNEVDPEHTNLITTARRINDMMPIVTARKIRHTLAEHDASKILALGAAYKPNTYDTRNSPAIEIAEELRLDGYEVAHYDNEVEGMGFDVLEEVVDEDDPDAIVQLVAHDRTTEELDAIQPTLERRGVPVLRFGQRR